MFRTIIIIIRIQWIKFFSKQNNNEIQWEFNGYMSSTLSGSLILLSLSSSSSSSLALESILKMISFFFWNGKKGLNFFSVCFVYVLKKKKKFQPFFPKRVNNFNDDDDGDEQLNFKIFKWNSNKIKNLLFSTF